MSTLSLYSYIWHSSQSCKQPCALLRAIQNSSLTLNDAGIIEHNLHACMHKHTQKHACIHTHSDACTCVFPPPPPPPPPPTHTHTDIEGSGKRLEWYLWGLTKHEAVNLSGRGDKSAGMTKRAGGASDRTHPGDKMCWGNLQQHTTQHANFGVCPVAKLFLQLWDREGRKHTFRLPSQCHYQN